MARRRNATQSLEQLIDLYVLRCEVEGKSPNTIRAYRETLGRFVKVSREESFPTDVAHIEHEHLYRYLGRFSELAFEFQQFKSSEPARPYVRGSNEAGAHRGRA